MDSIHRSARLLRVLSHPVRLNLLNILNENEQCVCHLTAFTGKRQACVSQHLAALRAAGILRMRKDGLRVYYRLDNPHALAILRAVNIPRSNCRAVHGCECPKCAKNRS